MANRVTGTIWDITKAFSIVFRNILEFKFLFVTIMVVSLTFLIANPETITVDQKVVNSYSVIAFGVLILALIWKVDLRKFTWNPQKPVKRGLFQSPTRLPTIIVWGIGSAGLTLIILAFIQPAPNVYPIPGSTQLNIAFQQIFLIALVETVIFQGVVPLLIDKMFIDVKTNETMMVRYAWVVTYTISQTAFALMHYTVYGADLVNMFIVGVLGTIWYFQARHIGIASAWWSHALYNCWVLGLIGGV